MPKFSYGVKVSASSDKVYNTLKNMDAFNQFMNAVKKVEIVKQEGNKLNTKWIVDFDGVPIEWTEENVFNDSLKNMEFKSISGDFSRDGRWSVFHDDKLNKTIIKLEMSYNWNVPNFEGFFGNIYTMQAEKASKGMIYALKKKVANE